MRVRQNLIDQMIKDARVKAVLSLALGVTIYSIYKYLDTNKVNGDLTKVAAVNAISKYYGITSEDVLEEVPEVQTQN